MENQSVITRFSSLIEHSVNSLHHSSDSIRKMFPENATCLLEYIEKDMRENILEIRFDNEEITLCCSFDGQDNCNMTLLLLDNFNEIEHCIDYLNDIYKYDYLRRCWQLPNNRLCIKRMMDDIYFTILA